MADMLHFLEFIQGLRNPFLDQFFIWITILGEEYVAVAILALVLWCVDKRAGYMIGFAYISSWILNLGLKEIFQVPRPFNLDQNIVPIRPETAGGYSFPSGHTQGIAALSAAFVILLKKTWFYLLAGALITLMAFSRLYLGVHTPLDVLGGAVLGIGWVWVAHKLFDYMEATGRKSVSLAIVVPMALGMIFFRNPDYFKIAGTFCGLLAGYLVDGRWVHFEAQGLSASGLGKYIGGILVLLAVKEFGKNLGGQSLPADFLRYLIMGLWITILAPLLFNIPGSRQLASARKKAAIDELPLSDR